MTAEQTEYELRHDLSVVLSEMDKLSERLAKLQNKCKHTDLYYRVATDQKICAICKKVVMVHVYHK